MDIHALFERHWADMHDCDESNVRSCRLSNGSYNNLAIARGFRSFRAGFEAKLSTEMQLLGYLSNKGVLRASQGSAAYFRKGPTGTACIPVFIKQCEPHKTGE